MCEYLPWDSDFFGRRIGRATANRLSEPVLSQMREWKAAQHIECLYFLADSGHAETIKLAGRERFQLVDVRVTLERKGGTLPPPGESPVRPCRADDVSVLRAIARASHRDSRFYHDEHFPESLCDALYETWIEKSVNGYADAVLVFAVQGAVAGYITCHLRNSGEPHIGLFAVAEHARGRGAGAQLVTEALRWFEREGAAEVSVVTQGRNIPGQRLYQKCGFVTRSVQLWYHDWSGTDPGGA